MKPEQHAETWEVYNEKGSLTIRIRVDLLYDRLYLYGYRICVVDRNDNIMAPLDKHIKSPNQQVVRAVWRCQ